MWIATNDKCPCVGEGKEQWAQSKQCKGHPWPVQLLVFYSGFLHSGCLWKLWSKETYTMVGRYRLEVDHCNLHGLCLCARKEKSRRRWRNLIYARPKKDQLKNSKNITGSSLWCSLDTPRGELHLAFLPEYRKPCSELTAIVTAKVGVILSLFPCLPVYSY